jgi:hypothetical protein
MWLNNKYDQAVDARSLERREIVESAMWIAEASVRLSMGQAGFPVADCLQAAQEAAQGAMYWSKKAQALEAEVFGEEVQWHEMEKSDG